MNIYSHFIHSALKYLKNTEVNILNLLIMTGNFDIRDSLQDSSFPHHSAISDNFLIIVDSFNFDLSSPTHCIFTRYLDMSGESNLVINLIFLQSGSTELNNHSIHPEWQLSSDHVPLTVSIAIVEENFDSFKFSIVKNSNKEACFIKDVSYAIKSIGVTDLSDSYKLEEATTSLALRIEHKWNVNLKHVKIMKHSKSW